MPDALYLTVGEHRFDDEDPGVRSCSVCGIPVWAWHELDRPSCPGPDEANRRKIDFCGWSLPIVVPKDFAPEGEKLKDWEE